MPSLFPSSSPNLVGDCDWDLTGLATGVLLEFVMNSHQLKEGGQHEIIRTRPFGRFGSLPGSACRGGFLF